MATCISCNKDFPDSRMILSGRGPVCVDCSAAKENDSSLFRGIWLTVISGPSLAVTATSLGCLFAVCSGIGGPVVYAIGGLAVIANAIRSLSLVYSLSTDYSDLAVSPIAKGSLVVSSVVSGLWGVALLILAAGGFYGYIRMML